MMKYHNDLAVINLVASFFCCRDVCKVSLKIWFSKVVFMPLVQQIK
ncbi:Uncharacterized protein APZ42_003735 [Daphnia magna]|uniref:Uncharacterized protein n=1 Tax=Daphnia magna TaxID=35525 RepID=A0A168EJ97_9CRUS|nr:Uncharacterized protein APZ42_003735 [Daphnia magna]